MNKQIEGILEDLEQDGTSAGATVAEHIRMVAANGPEYRTPEAIEEEASALIEAAMTLYKPLRDAKAAAVGESNKAMNDYIVRWEIDMEADSPEQAAAKALIVQRNNDPANAATVFDVATLDPVTLKHGPWVRVDLSDSKGG